MMPEMTRREFLKSATMAAAVAGNIACPAAMSGASIKEGGGKSGGLIDTNVWLSRWPFRRLPLDDASALVAKLRSQGVTQAWTGTFDGILHKDLGSANARLAQTCKQHGRGLLVPFGAINPQLPDWEEELRRCREEHRMRGIRLHPNCHGYKLDQTVFGKLLDRAGQQGLIVQIAISMEDERMQHPLMQVSHVDALPLVDALKTRPRLKVVLLNWFRAVKAELLGKLAGTGQVYFDIAMVEGAGGVENLVKQIPAERVLFGSYAPFFYFESAALKLKESVLTERELERIKTTNARELAKAESH